MRLQIVVDCADPHRLVRFWAAATGSEVEDVHELVTGVLAAGAATEADTIEIDGRLAWRDATACSHPAGDVPRMLFQRVPEPKVVKNRWHVDLHVGEDRRAAVLDRLLALGATRLWDGRQGPQTWVTLADPEGNELCLA